MANVEQVPMTGGLSEQNTADETVQRICDSVKAAVIAQNGIEYTMFNAVAYKTQVVAGTNYFVKVQVGSDAYIELRIFQSLDQKCSLAGILPSKYSEIVYFD